MKVVDLAVEKKQDTAEIAKLQAQFKQAKQKPPVTDKPSIREGSSLYEILSFGWANKLIEAAGERSITR